MNRIKAWVRAFFGFSRMETNGFIILLPLMAVIILAEPVYQYWFTHQPQDFSRDQKKLDSLLAALEWETTDSTSSRTSNASLFTFNPNLVSQDSLELLGLSAALSKRIVNYRSKGGKFYSIKDLKKIYGMDSSWASKIERYAVFPIRNVSERKDSKPFTKETIKTLSLIDLNLADTTQLKSVYGIGSKLSARIILYRNKLGGFVSLNQLSEVYGLDSAVVNAAKKKFFVEKNFQPVSLNPNTADEKTLASHPYLKSKLARVIIAYRQQHGDFSQPGDLKKISILTEETFEKIKPYLSTNP